MSKIYLAIPYTNDNPDIMQYRYDKVTKITARLMADGHIVYSPITFTHYMAQKHNLPTDYEFWSDMCESFIEWCDELHIVMMNGIETSKGVQAEMACAVKLNKPIMYYFDED